MAEYSVNTKAQPNGDHEVHRKSCAFFPATPVYLGTFNHCRDAVKEARRHYVQVNGCYFCSRECHTT